MKMYHGAATAEKFAINTVVASVRERVSESTQQSVERSRPVASQDASSDLWCAAADF